MSWRHGIPRASKGPFLHGVKNMTVATTSRQTPNATELRWVGSLFFEEQQSISELPIEFVARQKEMKQAMPIAASRVRIEDSVTPIVLQIVKAEKSVP